MGKVSFHLAPVVDHMFKELKTSSKLFADETRCPVLDPGRGKTKTGYLWAIARDERLNQTGFTGETLVPIMLRE
jgi:transposase